MNFNLRQIKYKKASINFLKKENKETIYGTL